MSTSNEGVGRSIPANGSTNQVPVIDITATDDLTWTYVGFTAADVQTADYVASFGEVVRGDTTSAGFNVTLPAPVKGAKPVVVTRTTGSDDITVVGTIDGGSDTTVSTATKTFVALDDESGYLSY